MTVEAEAATVSQVDTAAAIASARPRCSTEDMLQLLQDYDCWVFDLDGTIWRGNEVIEGVLDSVELLRKLGKKVIFMTNNSMKSRGTYLDKCLQLGLPAHVDDIYCSSYSAAAYLESIKFDKSKKAYVVGERGIMQELAAVGIESLGGPDDNDKRATFSDEMQHDTQVGAVVCGVDPNLSYYKVQYASMCLLLNPGCLFIATNTDSRGHFTPNLEWAGAGATVGAIKGVVEREPIVTGKPSPFLMQDIAAKHGVQPARSIMVGDRLDTDVLWGLNTGMATLLVMTGVTDQQKLAAQHSSSSGIKPHFVMDSFGDLRRVAREALQQQQQQKQQQQR
ncbi:phosphoglycolate phosphatase [Scenedesmus sp. NREL 46B-D3]|nr:phosphoglycolate phosphatase [Scenedesmus sp. NREL 46B-D3]